jgi:hypothetical protein
VAALRRWEAGKLHNHPGFVEWSLEKLEALGKKVLLLIWDNARSWHISKELRRWLGRHNRRIKEGGEGGEGVRVVSCLLPKQRVRGSTP